MSRWAIVGTRETVRPGADESSERVFSANGDLDGAQGAEAELLRGGRREVELPPGHEGPAVDDRRVDRAAVVAQRELRAARQLLVGHADGAGGQRAATAQWVAVEARAV